MDTRTLLLATGAALALAACQTTPDDDDQGASSSPSASASSTASGGSWSDPNDNLHDRVHDALMEQMGPLVNDVGVKTDGSKVILTGYVSSEADKQKAHDIAHAVEGATVVDISGLSVQP